MGEVKKLDFGADSTPILDEEDEATLAAIDRGIQAAGEGRVVPCPVCAQPVPFLAIGIHPRFEPTAVQVFCEARYIQVQLSGPACPDVETGGTQQPQNRLQRELAAADKIAVTHETIDRGGAI